MTWKPDYVTLPAMKNYLDVDDTIDDTQISLWITAASRAVDRYCSGTVGRQFGKADAPVSRTYRRPAFWDPDLCLWVLEIDDLQDPTGLTVGGIAYATSGATLLPDNALADGEPYTSIGMPSQPTGPVTLVALWGWSAVPAQVQGAVYLQANRWNFRRKAAAGIAGSPDNGGSELRLLARLDPDVVTVLVGLKRRDRAA